MVRRKILINTFMFGLRFIQDKNLESKPLAGLYIIATPIGNKEDITIRAANLINSVDYLYAEDPRNSLKLLQYLDIKRPLRSYNDQANDKLRMDIIALIKNGHSIGLISDAGTPLISDPGYKLVTEIHKEQLDIFPIAGASAVTAALSCSGLPSDKFHFYGFPPRKSGQLESFLHNLTSKEGTFIFYESAVRVQKLLALFKKLFPDQKVFIARELTKMHEEKILDSTNNISEKLNSSNLKGEFVIILHNKVSEKNVAFENDLSRILDSGKKYLSQKDLSKFLSEISNLSKNDIYNLGLEKTKNE